MAKSRRRRKNSRDTGTRCLLAPIPRSLRYERLEYRRLLAVVTVDTYLDVVDFTDGVTSLREAIFATNLVGGADEIQFDFGHDGPETILLMQGELAITDSLTINGLGADLLTIDASGNDPTPDSTPFDDDDSDDGDGSRVFNIDDGDETNQINAKITNLALTGGDLSGGFDIGSIGRGGAIRSIEDLKLVSTRIFGNTARSGGGVSARSTRFSRSMIIDSEIVGNMAFGGGGIDAQISDMSSLSIIGTTIAGNTASLGGGVMASPRDDSTIEIFSSTISGNLAASNSSTSGNLVNGLGGGVYASAFNSSRLLISSTTITGNSVDRFGGGISSSTNQSSTFTIDSSTISGNSANNSSGDRGGGGVYSRTFDTSTFTISSSTISENISGGVGGGIFIRTLHSSETAIRATTISRNVTKNLGGGVFISLLNSVNPSLNHAIVGNNISELTSSDDIFGTIDVDWSLVETSMGATIVGSNNIFGLDPLLTSLTDNGGPTLTHALLPGSPAIDAGDSSLQQGDPGLPEFDQRGAPFARVASGRIDIGAYEAQPATGSLSGDFDHDGDADGFDFLAWQRGLGMTNGAVLGDGDATSDGDVDGNDGSVWEETFGQVATAPTVAAPTSDESELESSFATTAALTEIAPSVTRATAPSQLVHAAMAWELAGVIREQEEPAVGESQAAEEMFRDIAFADEDIAATGLVSFGESILGTSSSESEPSEIEWLTDELLELILG